ncbi:DNA topoisomerase III [Lysinibacillus sphaericus OT4b.31]|uniref:DNA topoisomerase III n=1 Tax=Lysinibacillus sphaericus OT4b.31 TaxID=1285586 RepID=R7Z9Y1_LYSSH|nr:DNA topoisomerase III [Lysinibacillus sphaericus OT4b.31]
MLKKYQQLIGQSFEPVLRGQNKRYVDGSNVGEHYTIIPTKKVPTEKALQSMPADERNIYFEILNTTLAMFHQDFEYDEKTILTNVKKLEFKSVGKTGFVKGWKELFCKLSPLNIEAEQFTKPANKDIVTCPACKVGKISLRKNFYGCSDYKNGCKQTFPERLLGKKLSEKNNKDLCSSGKTTDIKGFKAKSGKQFRAALHLVDGKIEFDFNNK